MTLKRNNSGTECADYDVYPFIISEYQKYEINKAGLKINQVQIDAVRRFLADNDRIGYVRFFGIGHKDTIFNGALILVVFPSRYNHLLISMDGRMFFGFEEYAAAMAVNDTTPFRISEQLKFEIKKSEKKSGLKVTDEQIETAQRFLAENGGSVRGISNKDNVFKGALIINSDKASDYILIANDGRLFIGLDDYAAAMNQE